VQILARLIIISAHCSGWRKEGRKGKGRQEADKEEKEEEEEEEEDEGAFSFLL